MRSNWVGVSLSILMLVRSVAAQPAVAQAEALFREGRELLTAGKVAEACAAFEQSQKLEPQVTTLLNIAGCREKNGQLATAWGLFLDAERQTRDATDKASQKLHAVALDHANRLAEHVPKLTIRVSAENRIDQLEISRGADRIEEAMWNHALPIDGGTYTISARAPGAQPWKTQIQVAPESDNQTVDIPNLRSTTAEPLKVETTTPTPTRYVRRGSWKLAAASLAAGGVLVGVGGIIFQFIASSDPADGLNCYQDGSTDGVHGNYSCGMALEYTVLDERLATRNRFQIAAISSFVAAPTLLVAAVGLLYFAPKDAVVVPVATHDSVGFAITDHF